MRGAEEEFGPAPTLTPIFPNSTYGPIEQWDTSQVTDMSYLFSSRDRSGNLNSPTCSTYWTFNRNLRDWDVSRVTTMKRMFYRASAFNGNIEGWDTSKVTNMDQMFYKASAFNRDLSGWNIAQVRGRCRWSEG